VAARTFLGTGVKSIGDKMEMYARTNLGEDFLRSISDPFEENKE